MRDTSNWRRSLINSMRREWPIDAPIRQSEFCSVELGLRLLSRVAPQASATSLWALLTGYPFPVPSVIDRSDNGRMRIENGRQLLPYFTARYQWEAALNRYRQVEDRFRGFDVDNALDQFSTRDVTVAADRFDTYDNAIDSPVPYREDRPRWAKAGKYRLPSNGIMKEVDIPDDLEFAPPDGHILHTGHREPVSVTWNELLATAESMEQQVPRRWPERLARVRLQVAQDDGLCDSDELEIAGLAHIIGMVSSGKSTLMDVITVWSARQGLHTTVVVGDVMDALSRAQLFHDLGFRVAPVLGRFNREKHLNRLHNLIRESQPSASPFAQKHIGFRWLSTVCPLNGFMELGEAADAKALPCADLQSIQTDEDSNDSRPCACPIFSRCPVHNAQRELVAAQIWVSTPAGLVYARVASQLNQERIRFLELACRKSDLIIVDEADRVQIQFDSIFSPTQTLVSPVGGWLDTLSQRVTDEKAKTGRGQLADMSVSKWVAAHHDAQGATDRIAALLQQEPDIAKWISQRDYFTGWQLLNQLANDLIDGREEQQRENPEQVHLPELFRDALDELAVGRFSGDLSNLALQAQSSADDDGVRTQFAEWIARQTDFSGPIPEQELTTLAKRLEFALLVASLQSRLNVFIRDWKLAEDALKLAEEDASIFFRPPRDYEAIIPAAPMGNVLAFQFIPPAADQFGPGELRFLRCMGVGRWMLTHMHELFAGDGPGGPNVMLLSGTSWAGDSPSYDLQAPVTAVLRSPEEELQAIYDSSFEFLPIQGSTGKPIRVSGKSGDARLNALKDMVRKLSDRGAFGTSSRLEREREQLTEGRKRILLLVGSYDEAAFVRRSLESLRPDWSGQVLNLVRDDTDPDDQIGEGVSSLKRGQVDQLRSREAWILVAPLLAIERGHNILNDEYVAALGAAFFLVRIHPPPDDMSFAIQSINRWAVSHCTDADWITERCQLDEPPLDAVGAKFRSAAYSEWRHLLKLQMIYSTLPVNRHRALTWNLLVTIWQVIGRLVRGGQPARIYFCDAAFAPNSADGKFDTPSTSLLLGMRSVLNSYFDQDGDKTAIERELANTLYGPLFSALQCVRGVQSG